MRLPTEQDIEDIKKMCSTLPPFTITFTDPKEASLFVNAIFFFWGKGEEGGMLLSSALGMSCQIYGNEAGIDSWLEMIGKTNAPKMPKFMKPLLLHYFNHVDAERKKEQQ